MQRGRGLHPQGRHGPITTAFISSPIRHRGASAPATWWCSAISAIGSRRRGELGSQQRERAEAASQHKTRLMAALSHDARTPLNAVVLAAQLLELHFDGESDDEVQECLRMIRHSVRNVLDLLGDLLDLSKIDADARSSPYQVTTLLRSIPGPHRMPGEHRDPGQVDEGASDDPIIEARAASRAVAPRDRTVPSSSRSSAISSRTPVRCRTPSDA